MRYTTESITLTGGAQVAPAGFGGDFASGFFDGRHELRERDRLAVGRPRDGARTLDEIREQRGLSGIHPAHVELRTAIGRRHVREPRAIGRPARRAEALRLRTQRTVVSAVDVHDPQIAARAVRHDVEAGAHVDDAAAVGRDLHIVGVFELEHVERLQTLRIGQAGGIRRNVRGHPCRAERGKNIRLHAPSSKGIEDYSNRQRVAIGAKPFPGRKVLSRRASPTAKSSRSAPSTPGSRPWSARRFPGRCDRRCWGSSRRTPDRCA